MPEERKRRKDAVYYEFYLYNCADYLIKYAGKTYAYQTVIMREATRLCGKTQAVFSLYRELHKTTKCLDIHGVRAICLDDFNAEHNLCLVHMFADKGKSCLTMLDSI